MSLHKNYRWKRHLECPLCGRRIRFNWWWLLDVDTYFYCRHCGIRLVQISFVLLVLMLVFAAGHLYNLYQTLSAAHVDVSDILIKRAVLYFVLIGVIRVVLLFILFKLKFAKTSGAKKQDNTDSDIWLEPFVDNAAGAV